MMMKTLVALAALLGTIQPMAAQANDKVFALVPMAMNNRSSTRRATAV